MIGQVLGHYKILDQLGAGGMGVVYRAHDEQLDRYVAVKVLPAGVLADEGTRKRFRQEALALAKLNHPNIETVHQFGSQDGVDFLVMELISGVPLNEKLKSGPLSERDVMRLGMQLADGLTAAHECGVVHSDLKPANIFITGDNRLKILDFGLARLLKSGDDNDLTQDHHGGKRPDGRHAAVHVSRAASRRTHRSAKRHLRGRDGSVRDGDGNAPVSAASDCFADRRDSACRASSPSNAERTNSAGRGGRDSEGAR